MEVVLLLAGALILAVMVAISILIGWNAAVRKFGGNAEALTKEFARLDEVAQRDPARMGIDIGKRYATDRVRETLNDIDGETET